MRGWRGRLLGPSLFRENFPSHPLNARGYSCVFYKETNMNESKKKAFMFGTACPVLP